MKQTFKAPKNSAGEDINLRNEPSTGGGSQFALIPQGFYLAIMTSMKEEIFVSKAGDKAFLKVQPEFTLLNDNGTILNRQDFTVGNWDAKKKQLFHPDGKFPIWGGNNGALFLFKSLGLFQETDEGYEFELNTKIVKDRAIKIRTGIAGYIKGNTPLSLTVNRADTFNTIAVEIISELTNGTTVIWGMEDIPRIVEHFNAKNGLDAENGLKTKNVIVGFYPVSERDVSENGWYVDDTGAVYTTKAGYDWYVQASVTEENPKNDW